MAAKREKAKKTTALFGDAEVTLCDGGETHQTAGGDTPVLTTQQGIPVADDQNSLKVGARGPTVLEDFHFREKIFHFDHERIPERVVHARGYGAHGFFESYESLADITRADLVPASRREDARLRALLDRRRQQRLGRPRPRRARLCREALHQGGQLGHRRQQHPGLLHPGRDQVPRPDPRRQAGAGPRLSAGADGPRQFLGLHLALAREHAHGACGSCRTGRSRARSGSWRASASTPSAWSTPRGNRPSSSSTGSRSRACSRSSGTRRSRSTARTPISIAATSGTRSQRATFPNGSWAFSSSTRDFADSFAFDVLDATKLIPEEDVPIRIVGRLVLDRVRRQFLRRDRAGRLLHAEHRARASTSPTIRCCRAATSPISTRRSNGWAARTSPTFPINAPKCPFAHFQQDGHMAMHNPNGPRQLRAKLVGCRTRGPRESPARGFQSYPAPGGRSEAAYPLRDVCRPLQPGPAILHQPDRGRATAHRIGSHFRAEQGSDAGDPVPDGVAPAEYRFESREKVADGLASSRNAQAGRRRQADAHKT